MKKLNKKADDLIKKYPGQTAISKASQEPELLKLVELKLKRKAEKLKIISVKKWCDNRILTKLNAIAKAMPDEGYSMGSLIVVNFAKLTVFNDRTSNYSNGCKCRATHGKVELKMNLNEFINTSVIGGLITYIEPNQKSLVKKCYWYYGVGSKQNFQLIKVNGFIFNGYHGNTKEEAKQGGQYLIDCEKQKEKEAKNYKKALRLQYTFQDSLKAGNCEAGSEVFCKRCGIDKNKTYRGTFLIKIATQKGLNTLSYLNRMIAYKASKLN